MPTLSLLLGYPTWGFPDRPLFMALWAFLHALRGQSASKSRVSPKTAPMCRLTAEVGVQSTCVPQPRPVIVRGLIFGHRVLDARGAAHRSALVQLCHKMIVEGRIVSGGCQDNHPPQCPSRPHFHRVSHAHFTPHAQAQTKVRSLYDNATWRSGCPTWHRGPTVSRCARPKAWGAKEAPGLPHT